MTQNLALVFQEVLTAVVRLRANRQAAPDAESFRRQFREALRMAAQEAQRAGYSAEDTKLATFAVVALLDESVLNSRNPLFAEWPRKPLQEELFGVHVAGEMFFQNLQQLLGRNDSPALADLLEVHYLCLLLGYGGRYSMGSKGELRAIMNAAGEKIRRIRGGFSGLAPAWALPPEVARPAAADPWVRRLLYTAVGLVILTVLLFTAFSISLGSGASELRAFGAQGRN